MEHTPSAQPASSAITNMALRAVVRMVSRIEQKQQPNTFTHVQPHAHATARLSRLFAARCLIEYGNRELNLEEIEFAAYMHDLGKYYIDPDILLKPAALDEEEQAVMRLHPVLGALVISRLPGTTRRIRSIVLHHHEHWDGSGYPDGLSGREIPLAARIVGITDVYTALRARRSYKPILSKLKATQTLVEMAGRELDPYLVEDFVSFVGCPA
ncbi:MAG TPA: HD domain-containing phosphohydrolase [Pyrinomonadaceae bacterium]|jgi:HD-GYP domain-containing protein (c-di-GMP phosphodiesterase class II)